MGLISANNDSASDKDEEKNNVEISRPSIRSTRRVLPTSSIFARSSLTQNDSYAIVRARIRNHHGCYTQKKSVDSGRKNENRISGGAESIWKNSRKRRVHHEQICYGERIADDLINEYCDKLNTALRNRFDGMLAMQYILLEPQNLDKFITSRKPVLQILLDQRREHYVLVERNFLEDTVVVFDSLANSRRKARDALNQGLAEQIFNMFGHLTSNNEVKVRYEIAIEKQDDMWSCGLHAIAYVTCRAFDYDPQCYVFKMDKVFKYFCNLLNVQSPNVQQFRHAFGRFAK
ncbi:unnamed protein product [Thelazia callipaeda]|uniref:ULP_PROTEASE domain-containing protein n=1 Tax=Thelazia callipaeda TaxID=103827 RepID=A0A158RBE6_THECL|nr:unnamed protein product [Thelazia callipaeda]